MTVPDPHTAAILARDDAPPVDTSANGQKQRYLAAAARAKHKGLHWGIPTTSALELPPTSGAYCRGQLRTAYVRRPPASWDPIGIACDGCGAFWPVPR